MSDLDKFMVDKIERTPRFKELKKEIESLSQEILDLKKQDNKFLKQIPKPSTEKLDKLKNEKEVLRKLLNENRIKQKNEEGLIREKRRFLLSDNLERKKLKDKIRELKEKENKLILEQRNEMKKDIIWKDGKSYSHKEFEKLKELKNERTNKRIL